MSETFLDLNLNSYVPPVLASDGEYQLRIEADPTYKALDGGMKTLSIRVSAPDHPEVAHFYHTLWLPDGRDEASDNTARGRINTFCDKFGIPRDSGISLIGWAGLTAWANVITKTDKQGVDRNIIKSFV